MEKTNRERSRGMLLKLWDTEKCIAEKNIDVKMIEAFTPILLRNQFWIHPLKRNSSMTGADKIIINRTIRRGIKEPELTFKNLTAIWSTSVAEKSSWLTYSDSVLTQTITGKATNHVEKPIRIS